MRPLFPRFKTLPVSSPTLDVPAVRYCSGVSSSLLRTFTPLNGPEPSDIFGIPPHVRGLFQDFISSNKPPTVVLLDSTISSLSVSSYSLCSSAVPTYPSSIGLVYHSIMEAVMSAFFPLGLYLKSGLAALILAARLLTSVAE